MIKLHKIINFNKLIQNKFDINLIYYKKYYEKIIIEIIVSKKEYRNYFINDQMNINHIIIYFNDNNNEIKQNYFSLYVNITKNKNNNG